MNIMQLITMITNMIAEAKAGNWMVALGILMDIIKAIPTPTGARFASPARAQAFASCDGKTEDELLADLEALCKQHQSTAAQAGPVNGMFLDSILPILVALFKKWVVG